MINPPSTNFAEQWVKQYTHLNKAISYKAFDFNGIKQSLVNYLRTYHPEHFNNLTETDELLALIEMFAYVGELYAYRADVNTQEHVLSATTRKSSAIQIANMLGYTPSRRVAAVGLVKLTSVSTTESIIDADGSNLARRVVKWADQSNSRWKSQFELVLRRVLNTTTGVFSDSDKTQVENITFERYVMNTTALVGGVFKYTATVNGLSVPMELVGTRLQSESIVELPPTGDRPLDLLYANDGFGDTSPSTGYMFLTKQGNLSSVRNLFDGSSVNLTQPINAAGINDTDVWLNAVDAAGAFTTAWTQVDNVAYNQSSDSTTFQVVSRENDQVSLVFGDGNYSTIPNGNFDIWYRTSLELDSTIPVSAIANTSLVMQYVDAYGNNQTLTCTFSLQSPLVTSSSSETLAKLQQAVPGVFYTQDRMVNAQDYQNYLLQDPSIVKIKAVNRTFAGHSKYSSWHDGSESYDNVKIFSDDGILYLDDSVIIREFLNTNNSVSYTNFVSQKLSTLLQYQELWAYVTGRLNGAVVTPRTYFTPTEQSTIAAALQGQSIGSAVGLQWNNTSTSWVVTTQSDNTRDITIRLLNTAAGWSVQMYVSKVMLHSASTRFWQYSSVSGIDYDTVNPTNDLITVLKANTDSVNNPLVDTIRFKISNNVELQRLIPYQASVDLHRVQITEAVGNTIQLATLFGSSSPTYVYFTPDGSPTTSTGVGAVRKIGRSGLNFLWQHFTDQFDIINPARTNIIDLYVVTKQYYADFVRWLQQSNATKPMLPTVSQLATAYSKYMQKAMMSDELVLRPGKFKVLFGPKATPTLRATIQLVLAPGLQASKDAIKQDVVNLVRQYFDITNVEFGDTLYFSNLSAYLQNNSKYALGSILLVPLYPGYQFGDLYELTAAPDEIFVADISVSDVQVVDQLTSTNLRQ
jgi:hypothetical protein